jgi:lambda family phage portal protein
MFDAGNLLGRRLRAIPSSTQAINQQIRQYGATVLARSRYLAANNSYAAAAKDAFVSSLVGTGIRPSPKTTDAAVKKELREAFDDWTDQADADWLTDFYGQQTMIAGEMFDAGECFVRFRTRRPEDGLAVPFQLQVLPSEMCPIQKNEDLGNGRRVECGIEFDPIGRRTAYHFYKVHPGSGFYYGDMVNTTVPVPADEVLHLYRPVRAGQIRGIPHTLSAITTLALLDLYDDAELERKRIAALFAAFVTRNPTDEDDHPLGSETVSPSTMDWDAWGNPRITNSSPTMEPGATIDLQPGEDVKFSEPADVGMTYEPFQYRNLLRVAVGFGVPYAEVTGDLHRANYGSIRAGLITFRRKITAMQHGVMVYQLCRPVWNRWLDEAVLAEQLSLSAAEYLKRQRELQKVKWVPPAWEWIDPLKDIGAEVLAVDNHFKPRSQTIEEGGYDPEEVDQRILEDETREKQLGITRGPPEPGQAVLTPAQAGAPKPALTP